MYTKGHNLSHHTNSKPSRTIKRARHASLALTIGIAIGMNSSPLITRGADAAGIDIPQAWTTNAVTPMSEVVKDISQASTTLATASTLSKTSLRATPHTTANATDDTGKNTTTDSSSKEKPDNKKNTDNNAEDTKKPHINDTSKTQELRAILSAGIKQNFATSTGTFYVPLEGHTAPAGMTLIGVRGTFVTASAGQNLDTAIDHINKIRKDAYDCGLVDRYVPVSRAPALERTAQIRAVEATVYPTHTRPNGQDSSTLRAEGFAEDGLENLAWGGRTLHAAIDQWAAEKQNYINAKKGNNTGVSGHYAVMVDPDNTYVGLGMFTYSSGYGTTISGFFSSTNPTGPNQNLSGSVIQGIYVPTSAVANSPEFTLQSSTIGSKAVFSASTKVFNARELLEAEINQ